MKTETETASQTLADEAIDWLVLLRSGSVSADVEHEFANWLQQDATHREAYAEAQALWANAARVLKTNRPAAMSRPKRRHKRYGRLAAAAVLVFVVWLVKPLLVVWLFSDYSTAVGEQKQITLADGSQVLMNTDTAIALDWDSHQRRVLLLQGQAQFTVAKDAARPFEVVAGNTAIRALGTVFEVLADALGAVDVTVSEHAVAVSGKDGSGLVRVGEGERLHYTGNSELNRPEPVNLHQSNAWQRGKLIFKDRPLPEVIAELNRYSKARIVLQGEGVAQMRVSGVFPIDGVAVLDALQKALSLQAVWLGPWLVVLHG